MEEQGLVQPSAIVRPAAEAARRGDPQHARELILGALREHPEDASAWFWLACVTPNPWEALASLRRLAESGWGDAPAVRQGMEWAQAAIAHGQNLEPLTGPFVPPAEENSAAPRSREERHFWARVPMYGLALALVGLLLLSGWLVAGWIRDAGAAGLLAAEEGRSSPLDHAALARTAEGHWVRAEEALARGDFTAALGELDEALNMRPFDLGLQRERSVVARYVFGLERYRESAWPAAVRAFEALLNSEGDYRDTQMLLAEAYYRWGVEEQKAGELDGAERLYARSLQLHPGNGAVEARMSEIGRILAPGPTPRQAGGKKIVVDIASQRFYAYEGERLVYEFICSTGLSSSPTAPGTYEVLDKIPNAYSSAWHLDMPYWLGIYWAGGLENGIHALPILSTGEVLWEGYLGQPASFGCVILSTEDARTIYDWAEVGTPVIIQ